MKTASSLSEEQFRAVQEALDMLEALTGHASHQNRHMDQEIYDVVAPLLEAEGYSVVRNQISRGQQADIVAERSGDDVLIVESKFYSPGRKVGLEAVHQVVENSRLRDAQDAIIVTNTDFTAAAEDGVRRELPLNVQLLNFDALRNWAARLHHPDQLVVLEVAQIMREASQRLAMLIAQNEGALAALEWRDVERVMAEVFEGIGFDTTLTPPSKDGGKDVIISCRVKGRASTYYVEIKHWRSATRVGSTAVQDLLSVVVSENVTGGLFLSTYGFTANAFEQLTIVDLDRLRFAGKEKIVSLCKTYVKAKSGVWSPPEDLSEFIL